MPRQPGVAGAVTLMSLGPLFDNLVVVLISVAAPLDHSELR